MADGKLIQYASQQSLALYHTQLKDCFQLVKSAREKGLKVPVLFMGYANCFEQFGWQQVFQKSVESGVQGFIIVDLPLEEVLMKQAWENGLSFIPLIAPTTTEERMQELCSLATSFIYVISSLGVTGQNKQELNQQLPQLLEKVRKYTDLPLAVGFGVRTPQHFAYVSQYAEGVVIGSRLIEILMETKDKEKQPEALMKFVQEVKHEQVLGYVATQKSFKSFDSNIKLVSGKFGSFGGRFAPETLLFALDELEKAFETLVKTEDFKKEFESYYSFIGRPSKLQYAKQLSQFCGNQNRIWLKREDLNHTGSHKINNALGQVLLALKLNKKRIIAETGAGQHGVATATVCAHFNIPCAIYMGKTDTIRQSLNVFRIKLLGAEVIPVERPGQADYGTLKDAVNEAMRDWAANVETTHYVIGSAIGPHPFPSLVAHFQSVIGQEVIEEFPNSFHKQFPDLPKKALPDVAIACVGGGSNAIGLFKPLLNTPVQLYGIEAGGEGLHSGRHSAPLSAGTPGILHGCQTYLMQTKEGQIMETHSISAGLDYPGVGPEHAHLKDSKRAQYVAVSDREALIGFLALSRLEGVMPALETSHAVYHAIRLGRTLKDKDILINISGRGDKDVQQVQQLLSKYQLENFDIFSAAFE